MVARPGVGPPLAIRSATPLATRWRRPAAYALPSISFASAIIPRPLPQPRRDPSGKSGGIAGNAQNLVASGGAARDFERRFRQMPFGGQQLDHGLVGPAVLGRRRHRGLERLLAAAVEGCAAGARLGPQLDRHAVVGTAQECRIVPQPSYRPNMYSTMRWRRKKISNSTTMGEISTPPRLGSMRRIGRSTGSVSR